MSKFSPPAALRTIVFSYVVRYLGRRAWGEQLFTLGWESGGSRKDGQSRQTRERWPQRPPQGAKTGSVEQDIMVRGALSQFPVTGTECFLVARFTEGELGE